MGCGGLHLESKLLLLLLLLLPPLLDAGSSRARQPSTWQPTPDHVDSSCAYSHVADSAVHPLAGTGELKHWNCVLSIIPTPLNCVEVWGARWSVDVLILSSLRCVRLSRGMMARSVVLHPRRQLGLENIAGPWIADGPRPGSFIQRAKDQDLLAVCSPGHAIVGLVWIHPLLEVVCDSTHSTRSTRLPAATCLAIHAPRLPASTRLPYTSNHHPPPPNVAATCVQ